MRLLAGPAILLEMGHRGSDPLTTRLCDGLLLGHAAELTDRCQRSFEGRGVVVRGVVLQYDVDPRIAWEASLRSGKALRPIRMLPNQSHCANVACGRLDASAA